MFWMLSCVSHSIDICNVAVKNMSDMHAVSTNQIADILHFNDKKCYLKLASTNLFKWPTFSNSDRRTKYM